MTQIIVAHGLCSAIRPKLLTAPGAPLRREQYPTLRIEAVGKGRYGVPGTELIPFPDDDAWVQQHIAYIDVPGELSFACWIEYVLCRYMAANPQVGMQLMSKPLEPRNAKWAAKWSTLPPDWRQQGCKTQPYKEQESGILGIFGALFGREAPQRPRRTERRQRKQRRGR
jgi:hypothetical protein